MKQYNVTGMSCAACSARVEKAVKQVPGVKECSVSLLTNSMGVEGSAGDFEIIRAVEDAGYGASLKGGKAEDVSADEEALTDKETPLLVRRLIASMFFWLILMYFSMGYMMWGWPLPERLMENHIGMGLIQLLLTVAVMVINQRFFISGFKSLVKRAPNMDSLVALGASAAFAYSIVSLYLMSEAYVNGNMQAVMGYMDDLYFESAATILTLITVGKTLEARSKGKTTDALKGLMKIVPKTANVIRDENEMTVPISEVCVGDVFLVRPGERIPVDGVVLEGESAVDESALTGESIPVDKNAGDKISAATINESGFLKCQATRVGEDTTLSQIIKLVSDAAATKAPIAKIADRVSGIFVPTVISIALVTLFVWLIFGYDFGFSISRAISVLVISCPCALGLATPVAIMVGNGVGAKNGILFKTAAAIEETARINTVVLDKTGTITEGKPVVTDVISENEKRLYEIAAGLESKSEHPLAKAINAYAKEHDIKPADIENFSAVPGNGLKGVAGANIVYGGNVQFISKQVTGIEKYYSQIERLSKEGKTPLIFAENDTILGIIAVADTIKKDSKAAIETIKNMGCHVVMLTGDNKATAAAIASEAGVDEVIADVLPDEKEAVISRLKASGKVVMVGDGINDSPALVSSDVGMAIGAGSDVAIDAADVVLVNSSLYDVAGAIKIGRSTLRNIHQNLFWAFFYNVLGIPLAAGIWYPMFGLKLNPMFGAAAMSLSSFFVVSNALRLNFIKVHDEDIKSECIEDKDIEKNRNNEIYIKDNAKETKEMTKTINVSGMMCGHCEAHVKKALEAIDGVKEAVASHTEGTVVVTLEADVNDDVLKQAIVDAGYEVK